MARRKQNESFLTLLIELPWWVSVIAAGIAYGGLRYVVPGLFATNPFLVGIGLGLQQIAGLAAFVILLIAPLSLIRAASRRRLLDQQTGLDSIRAMSWQDFERLCGEAYRRKGFVVHENGGGGADGGIDLVLRRGGETWLVQCKRWKTYKVGVKEIRELYGIVTAEGATRGVFVVSGEYTAEAKSWAKDKPLELVDGPALLELVRQVQNHPAPAKSRMVSSLSHIAPEPVPQPAPVPAVVSPSTTSPACPQCGGAMVLRTARRGAKAGGQFWGCEAYPRCRGVRATG